MNLIFLQCLALKLNKKSPNLFSFGIASQLTCGFVTAQVNPIKSSPSKILQQVLRFLYLFLSSPSSSSSLRYNFLNLLLLLSYLSFIIHISASPSIFLIPEPRKIQRTVQLISVAHKTFFHPLATRLVVFIIFIIL